jgi:murein DD-endopeptidase MepM/ murein hydrolase activator NlpD
MARRVTGAQAAVAAVALLGVCVVAIDYARQAGKETVRGPNASGPAAGPPAEGAGADMAEGFEFTESGVFVRVAGAARGLAMPLAGVTLDQLRNTYGEPRADERRHIGIDIAAPRGTPLVAAVDGWIVLLSHNAAGGRGLHLLDRTGRYLLYYAHLDGYADDIWSGRAVRRRELIGYVGTSGNAATPHLHLEVGRIIRPGTLQVEPINPYHFLTRGPAPAATLAGGN